MNPANQKSAQELISELCEGRIQAEDRAKLMQMLRDDPLLQNEYLDQAMVEGMLQYEFAVRRLKDTESLNAITKSVPNRLLISSFVVFLLVAVFIGQSWWTKPASPLDIPIPLANLSFESDLPVSTQPKLEGWYGDETRIVTSSEGVLAPHGDRMLQFVRSVHQPSNECEVCQVLDLKQSSRNSDNRPVFLEAKMFANMQSSKIEASFVISLELYTFSDLHELEETLLPDRSTRDIMVSANKVAADSDPNSWQEIKLVMPLARDARYGIVRISAQDRSLESDNEYKEVFIDNVQVRMTNEMHY